jgi:two-component system OmpR family response regulator
MSSTKTRLFLVDDDILFLKSLELEFLEKDKYEIITFNTGEACIEALYLDPDIIVLDYHLDGIVKGAINGIETLDKIKQYNKNLTVIMLSSQDKIEVAVNCLHHKAYDYVVKSETAFLRLEKNITQILAQQKTESEVKWYMDRM